MLVQYLSRNGVGLFIRPPRGGSPDELELFVRPHLDQLVAQLQTKQEIDLGSRLNVDPYDQANWDQMADWLDNRTKAYQSAFKRIDMERP